MEYHQRVCGLSDGQHGQGGRLRADDGSAALGRESWRLEKELVHVLDAIGFGDGVGGGKVLANQCERSVAGLDCIGGISSGGGGGGIAVHRGVGCNVGNHGGAAHGAVARPWLEFS